MAGAAWIDGTVCGKLDATVSPFDHGLLFGDGVKCGFRLRAGEPVRLAEHFAVLSASARSIGLKLPFAPGELRAAVAELARATGRAEGYAQVLATRGAGALGPDPRKCEPRAVVLLDDLLPYPPELRRAGVRLITARSVIRRRGNPADRGLLLADAVGCAATREALAGGCLDALVTDADGRPTGTSNGVLFALRGRVLQTPAADAGPDPVARAAVLAMAGDLGWGVGELMRIEPGDELLFAGSGFGCVGVSALDGVALPGNGAAAALDARF